MANPNLHFFFLQDPATDELRYAYRFRHTSRVFRSADRADQSHFGKDAWRIDPKRRFFVGIVGDSNNVVKTVSADVPNAVTIEDAGVVGSGIHWFRLSRARVNNATIQAKDAKGTVVASFLLDIILVPKASGPTDFSVDPADPNHPNSINLSVRTPKDDADYIDTRMTAIGYGIYLFHFQVYCTDMNTPIDVPYYLLDRKLLDLNVRKAEPIDAKVYDTLAQANEAIRRAPAKAKGVTPFGYYRGAGGAVIAPTIFSPATTPRIVATYYDAQWRLGDYVEHELTGVAISIATGMVVRPVIGRLNRAYTGDPPPRGGSPPGGGLPPRGAPPPRGGSPPGGAPPPSIPKGGIRPVNDTVNVGGGGEIPNATNLNPIKPGSGGPSRGIPNHVKGGMEEMDALFVPGSVKTMNSVRLRYVDVDWPRATQAAAKVMPPGGKVSMNIWTQGQQEVAALKMAFERAGFKNVRIWGSSRGQELC